MAKDDEDSKTAGAVRSVERALAVLTTLTEVGNAGVAEIATNLGLHPTTVHRMLSTLVSLGWVEQDLPGRYVLSGQALSFGALSVSGNAMIQQAEDYLARLSEAWGFNAYLSLLLGSNVTHIARSVGQLNFGGHARFGPGSISHPANSMADGKLLLAYLPDKQLKAALDHLDSYAFTPRTITNRSNLERELEAIRERGYSLDTGERYDFLRGVAVPVVNYSGGVAAALVCLCRADDFPETKLQMLLEDMVLVAEDIAQTRRQLPIQAYTRRNFIIER